MKNFRIHKVAYKKVRVNSAKLFCQINFIFLTLNQGSNFVRIQTPLGKIEENSNKLPVLKVSTWILFHTPQELHFTLKVNPSMTLFTFSRHPRFQVTWYSSRSDISFVFTKHLPSQIHVYLTKKDIFCEENLKELLIKIIVRHRLMVHCWQASLCFLTK